MAEHDKASKREHEALRQCPKCHGEMGVHYCNQVLDDRGCLAIEHLHRTCKECTYPDVRPCLDHVDEPVPEEPKAEDTEAEAGASSSGRGSPRRRP